MANTKIPNELIEDDAITSTHLADNSVGIAALNVSDGTDGQALVTNGSGTLSFTSVGVSGISSSANATAITIDSSERVHINGGLGFKGDAITSCSGFSGTAGHYYWIKPAGALEPVYAQYSGDNYKSRGKGYFAWWRGYSEIAPSPNTDVTQVNFLDFGFKFYELLVEDESNNNGNGYFDSAKSYEYALWTSQQTFNQVGNNTNYANSHSFTTGNSVKMMLGNAGGHGLYDTTANSVCSWGNISVHAAIGSGYSGSCGTYNRIADTYNTSPLNVTYGMNLIMGRPGAGGAASANFQRSPGPFTYWCNF